MAKQTETTIVPEQKVMVSTQPTGAALESPADETQTPLQQPTTPVDKTFSQAEVDRIVKERLERERGKFADYDEAKKAAARLKEIEDAQKSELEKLQERLTQFEDQAKQMAAENKRLKLDAKIASIAGTLGAVDPRDPNFVMATQAIDPDGAGADDEIKKAIEALKAQRPYLFGQVQSPAVAGFNPADGAGGPQRETDAQRRARIYGSGGEIFDVEKATARGGGVHFAPGWYKK